MNRFENVPLRRSFVAGIQGCLLLLIFTIFFFGCKKLKPESISVPQYPDLEQLMIDQADLLDGRPIEKTVSLDDENEVNQLMLDSAKWIKELDFLEEINPNQPEYVGSFKKSVRGDEIALMLKEGEKGELKSLSYSLSGDQFQYIKASFHEDKDVYVHHREIEMNFKGGLLMDFKIDGYQKMMLKDTVRFGIAGKVLN